MGLFSERSRWQTIGKSSRFNCCEFIRRIWQIPLPGNEEFWLLFKRFFVLNKNLAYKSIQQKSDRRIHIFKNDG
jgi:hypothetical protein